MIRITSTERYKKDIQYLVDGKEESDVRSVCRKALAAFSLTLRHPINAKLHEKFLTLCIAESIVCLDMLKEHYQISDVMLEEAIRSELFKKVQQK